MGAARSVSRFHGPAEGERRRQHGRDEFGAAAARPGHERHARWQFDRLQLRAQRRSDRRAVPLDPRRGGQLLLLGRVICPGVRSSLQGQTHRTVASRSRQAQHRGWNPSRHPGPNGRRRRLRPRSRALWGAGPLQPLRVATRRGHRLSVGAPRAGRYDQWDTARAKGPASSGSPAVVRTIRARPLHSSAEDSPSGLWRTLGKRVGLTPSRVQIPYPPPSAPDPGSPPGFGALLPSTATPGRGIRLPTATGTLRRCSWG